MFNIRGVKQVGALLSIIMPVSGVKQLMAIIGFVISVCQVKQVLGSDGRHDQKIVA